MRILFLILILYGLALPTSAQVSLMQHSVRFSIENEDSLYTALGYREWQGYVKKHKVKSLKISKGFHRYASLIWRTKPRTIYMQEEQRYDPDGRLIYLAEKYQTRVNWIMPNSSHWISGQNLDRVEYWFTYDDGGRLIQEDCRRYFQGEVSRSRVVYLFASDNRYIGSKCMETGSDTAVFNLKSEKKLTYSNHGNKPDGYLEIEFPSPDSPVVERRLNMEYDSLGKLVRKYGEALRYHFSGERYEKVEWIYTYNGPAGELSQIKKVDEHDSSCVSNTWKIQYDGQEKVISHRYYLLNSASTSTVRIDALNRLTEKRYYDGDSLENRAVYIYNSEHRLLDIYWQYRDGWDGKKRFVRISFDFAASGECRGSEILGDQGDVSYTLPERYKWEYWTDK